MGNDERPLLSRKFHDQIVGQFHWRKRVMHEAGARNRARVEITNLRMHLSEWSRDAMMEREG